MVRYACILPLSLVLVGTIGCGDIDQGPFVVDGDFDRIEVLLSNGDLLLQHTDADESVITADFGGLAQPGGVGRYIEDGVLVVDYQCALCGGDVEVTVPNGVPVEVEMGQGDLGLEGLSGAVLANLRVGAITGTALSCDVQLSTRAGAIELEYPFRPNQLLVQTTFGAIEVVVPPGQYDLEFGSFAGVVNLVDVEHLEGADSSLVAFAEAGEITILGREAPW